MYPSRQSFLVFGLSRSGVAAAEFLLSKKAEVFVYDDVKIGATERAIARLTKIGAKTLDEEAFRTASESIDVLLLSPGVPVDHPIAVAFKRRKKAVIGETELAALYIKCPVFAITGTNGKTTTVTMLTSILKEAGTEAFSCGNIGAPMTNFVDAQKNAVAVAEISSFQLETLNSLRPHVAAVLNISEDHLNRHYTMENYVFLKKKLLRNLTEAEFAVLNYDDLTVRAFAESTKAKVVWFSLKERVDGAYIENGEIYCFGKKIVDLEKLPFSQAHNRENALAAAACAYLAGCAPQAICSALIAFRGVPHRIETVGKTGGVTYVNDSKATNVDSTLKAAQSMREETLLLLGGKDKGYDYDVLFRTLKNTRVVRCIVYGENAVKIFASAVRVGYKNVTLTENFAYALRIAKLLAQEGQTVLLSPASASFDEFSSYEERGEAFVSTVLAWQREEDAKKGEFSSEEKRLKNLADDVCGENGQKIGDGISEDCDGESGVFSHGNGAKNRAESKDAEE